MIEKKYIIDLMNYRANKKIFIKISGDNPLVYAIDENKLLGFASTISYFAEDLKMYSYELISSIINSKLINYFYSKSFSNSSDLTVNISTSYLEEIPIPKINKQNLSIIKKIEKEYKETILKKNDYETEKLDNLIFDLYNITKDEVKRIMNPKD